MEMQILAYISSPFIERKKTKNKKNLNWMVKALSVFDLLLISSLKQFQSVTVVAK